MKHASATAKRPSRPKKPATPFRITEYPMHYFAAIQRQNQINLGHALRPIGISPQEWRVLATLSDGEGRTIGFIAEAAVIDRSNLGRLLEAMAEEALVERATDPDDRRISLTRLTAEGMAKYEDASAIVNDMYRRLLDGLAPQEFAELMRILRRMKSNALRLAEG
jgi:MarR family transcriptional regulator, organic hydroperoxide resistance regulator